MGSLPVWYTFKTQALRVTMVGAFVLASTAGVQGGDQPDPFADHNGMVPPQSLYPGKLFTMNHAYPTRKPEPPTKLPWREALNGEPISSRNAIAYVNALKDYIAEDMKVLLFDYEHWDPKQRGWYSMPWLAPIRDSIHGTYVGSPFPKSTFWRSGLNTDMTTHVLTYYNDTAGYTLGQIWGETAMEPNLKAAQYEEGAIIVKAAFTTASGDEWPVMQGAAPWAIYPPPPAGSDAAQPTLDEVYLFQFDIIVKDTKTAPQTGWVFATLVYDKRVQGEVWDQMIPLGAMWGNDPDVNSTTHPDAALSENVINPKAPAYAKATLGWGGRLSGPNDGAVVAPAYYNEQVSRKARVSSCMSCHGVAEWPLKSFLLPTPQNPPTSVDTTLGEAMVTHAPGSEAFRRWFQDRAGTDPQDPGTLALDYGMNLAFKALPAWHKATQQRGTVHAFEAVDYRGLQLPRADE